MNNWIFIALGAGLTSAALHATIVSGSVLALVLFYLAPLPLFLAGLGWGPVAAAVGGLMGSAVVSIAIGIKPGLFFIVSTAAAPVLLAHLSLISRPAQTGTTAEGEAADQGTEWYPEGRLILWCAGVAGVLMMLSVFILGGSAEGFHEVVRSGLETMTSQIGDDLTEEQLVQLRRGVDLFSRLAAPLAASIWLLATLFNMWAASRILAASGHSRRPWAPFSSYSLPKPAGAALAASSLAAFLPGTFGLIGLVALFLLITVFMIIGLAALHGLTRGNPMRVFILSTTYMALMFLGGIAVIPLVILALIDLVFGLRQRRSTTT